MREAAESVLGQTLGDLELLIVDDASKDGTQDVLAALARQDERIRTYRLPARSGCNAARNHALERVRGRYVAMLDDDDIALPQRLEKSVARLASEPALGAVFAACRFIDIDGRLLDWAPTGFAVDGESVDGGRMFELLYCDWAWVPTSTLALRADVARGRRYPAIARSDGDSMLHCMLAAEGVSFARIAEPLALVRRGDGYDFMSQDRRRLLAARRESLRYLKRWLEERGIRRFDHLHARAWSNQLVREAEHVRGVHGLWLAVSALARWPGNPAARAYLAGGGEVG